MVMEKMEESSIASNSPTNQKIQTLAILLVPGSIEWNEEPKTKQKVRKTKDRVNLDRGSTQQISIKSKEGVTKFILTYNG